MNQLKLREEDYINFIIATPRTVTATEASSCQPDSTNALAHDAFTRLLSRLEPDSEVLWTEAQTQIDLNTGILVLDDRGSGKTLFAVQRLALSALVGQAKGGGRGHQFDNFAVDGRCALCAGRLPRV